MNPAAIGGVLCFGPEHADDVILFFGRWDSGC